MDECNLSFQVPAVRRHSSVPCSGFISNRQERRQTSMLLLSCVSSKSKAVPGRTSWQPQIVPYVHHEWHTDTVYEIDLVKAQDMSSDFHRTFSYAVVHFGNMSAECFARVVTHDQTVLCETKQKSVHRVTDCLTKIKNRKGSIS